MQRVVVTGLGAVTPLGLGISHTWRRLLEGQCGIVSLTGHGKEFEQQRSRVAALVPKGSKDVGAWDSREWLSRDEIRKTSLFMQYALYAAGEALSDAGWQPQTEQDHETTGICLGSGIGSFREIYDTSIAFHEGGAKKVSPYFVPKLLINLAAGHISMKYSLKGPSRSATTACTASAHSIEDAAQFIARNQASVMLAGGSESCIEPLAFIGFERSGSLTTSYNSTPELSSRPFDKNRSGFVIGEGATILVLEALPHALDRGANIYAELIGYGDSSDAHHVTAPPPDGDGAYRAMRMALRDAGIAPKDVDYINAHATSTPRGDIAENRAIKRLMLDNDHQHGGGKRFAEEINVSSTKGAVGHLLGAAGALEAAFTILAIRDGVMPPTLNLHDPGAGLFAAAAEFDNAAQSTTTGQEVEVIRNEDNTGAGGGDRGEFNCNYIPLVKQKAPIRVALTNSFGFGGTNASLCFRKFEG